MSTGKKTKAKAGRTCPGCDKTFSPTDSDTGKRIETLPFCSERCRTLDLGNWLDARYVVPEADDLHFN